MNRYAGSLPGGIKTGHHRVCFVDQYLTDDDADTSAEDFLRQLAELDSRAFGSGSSPSLVFHSVVGLREKDDPTEPYSPDEPVQEELCAGEHSSVLNSGEVYQELSRITGGLRFPLCEIEAYARSFARSPVT